MNNSEFYGGAEIRPRYPELIPTYQVAFGGEPWNEKSICVDLSKRCERGYSSLPVGCFCSTCGLNTKTEAFPAAELEARFDNLNQTRDTQWYIEDTKSGLAVAGLVWSANPSVIAAEKYPDDSGMAAWLTNRFGDEEILWLDEVFADRGNRPVGNLRNFSEMLRGFAGRAGLSTIAFRTITPQMIRAAKRDFNTNPDFSVPDSRAFIALDLGKLL